MTGAHHFASSRINRADNLEAIAQKLDTPSQQNYLTN